MIKARKFDVLLLVGLTLISLLVMSLTLVWAGRVLTNTEMMDIKGGTNFPPTAHATANYFTGTVYIWVEDTVIFDGSGSSDSDGQIVSYDWSFGEGSAIGSGVTTSHTYNTPGSYQATLTVTDDGNPSASDTATVVIVAVKTEIKEGATVVNDDGYVYINATPQMPQLTAKLLPPNLPDNVSWDFAIDFARHLQNHHDEYAIVTSASQTWNIATSFGNDFRGGTGTLTCHYKTLYKVLTIHIRGNNPTSNQVDTEIGQDPWFAQAICMQESSYSQFNTVGTLGPNPAVNIRATPNWGTPDGWGLMQLDPPGGAQVLWHWRDNVEAGLNHIDNPCATDAQGWIEEQERQQQEEDPARPLGGMAFTFNGVDFTTANGRHPIDACTIQRYNGAERWVIYWQNEERDPETGALVTPGSWEVNRNPRPGQQGGTYDDYVNAVCGRLN